MDTISEYLELHGPTRSSVVAQWLKEHLGMSADTARKRLSRIKPPIRRFPVALLPKGESFVYDQKQREEERFWVNMLRDMRATASVFGAAVDGMTARHGVVLRRDFAVISGATATPQKGQLMASSVADRLIAAGILESRTSNGDEYLFVRRSELAHPDWDGMNGRNLAEGIILDAVREWAKKLGLASFNTIKIRGDSDISAVGPFMFDLAGPSYLLPMQGPTKQPGFLVADAFADGILDEHQIRYFIRKAKMLQATLKGGGVLAILVAEGFTGPALTAGHAAGIVLATPKDLFGQRVGRGIQTLLETLKNAAAYAAYSPERLTKLIDDLSEIQGSAGNLRGVLFELLVAYLSRQTAVSIDMGVRARHIDTGKLADIDILKFTSQGAECIAIECKAKMPGATVTLEEVENWINRLPIFQSHLRSQSHLKEAKLGFELWTSAHFDNDALEYLSREKLKRVKFPIDWKDGQQVLDIAHQGKEKAIANALQQHFLKHPFENLFVSAPNLSK
jgi:hypothetical protein